MQTTILPADVHAAADRLSHRLLGLSFDELLSQDHTPTLTRALGPAASELADLYDAARARQDDPRRAWRGVRG